MKSKDLDNSRSQQGRLALPDNFTALLLPIRQRLRHWFAGHPDTSPENAVLSEPKGPHAPPTPPPPPLATGNDRTREPDVDAPTALLLPGMADLRIRENPDNEAPLPAALLPENTSPDRGQWVSFVSKPSPDKPDLFLKLPVEIQSVIFEQPELKLNDLVALRSTCRTLRRNLPLGIMEKKLTAQNFAGWEVVFEMNGHRYPGTTYGNRQLCGKCVRPKIRGHLIYGSATQAYLEARRRAWQGNQGLALDGHEEWPADRAMCFPCLYITLTAGMEIASDVEIHKAAAISPLERFPMLDGTTRKMCDRCSRDIHENAVPCPHCTDFSEWCKSRRT
ncbi:hypothetical protein QBC47DRAFT_380122 [Echria macrotheca]|uniref:F-box domain-containing protein n=1 Tax=Echria macrotheca TaxID=438768 RepID=A0AAJ0BDZ3_9PEZI|nr:hypothetical protein QBC47DRAFT_380122 [Echria macrotheca]